MATTILSAEKDPMGAAISDYFNHHRADRLRVFLLNSKKMKFPSKNLFRSIQSMPILERTALQNGYWTDFGCRCRKWIAMRWHFRKWEKTYAPLIFLRYLSK